MWPDQHRRCHSWASLESIRRKETYPLIAFQYQWSRTDLDAVGSVLQVGAKVHRRRDGEQLRSEQRNGRHANMLSGQLARSVKHLF